jgi:hypothetical protein
MLEMIQDAENRFSESSSNDFVSLAIGLSGVVGILDLSLKWRVLNLGLELSLRIRTKRMDFRTRPSSFRPVARTGVSLRNQTSSAISKRHQSLGAHSGVVLYQENRALFHLAEQCSPS